MSDDLRPQAGTIEALPPVASKPQTLPYLRLTITPFWINRLFGAKTQVKEFVLYRDSWQELPHFRKVGHLVGIQLNNAVLNLAEAENLTTQAMQKDGAV